MADVKTFEQGAQILQNVDVSSMVAGLALGIAEAQERLDNNSVAQLIRLSESKVGELSLLELGFQPAFYAFDYADISASINLKMAAKEDISVNVGLAVSYGRNATFDKDFFNQLKKNKSKSLSQYSKTQKDISLKVKTSENISVNTKSFKIHKEDGSYSKVEKAKEQMRDKAQELRADSIIEDEKKLEDNTSTKVYIAKEDGYVVIKEPYIHEKIEGLLKLDSKNYPTTGTKPEITLKGGTSAKKFTKETNFAKTLGNARTTNGGTVVGIDSAGIHRKTEKKVYEFFFDWDKYDINYTYSKDVKATAVNQADVTLLAMLLKRDASLKITINGYTDGSGSSSDKNTKYNEALGLKRAKAFRNELSRIAGVAFTDDRVKTATEGETLAKGSSAKDSNIRKVTVVFATGSPDYILFNDGEITTGASPKNTGPDHFVYVAASNKTSNTGLDIKFKYGGKSYVLRQGSTNHLASLTNNKGKYQELFIEKVNETYYLLHEETKINYFIHSKENKEVDVKVNNESSANMNKETTKVYVGNTQNELSRLKQSQKDLKGNNSLAIGGSLDVRYARQFNMSTQGNASVSARMVSVPPPTALQTYIQSLTKTETKPK